MLEQFQTLSGNPPEFKPGKIVCVGRNYAEHARELNNPIPTEPVLFIKPNTALADFSEPLTLPGDEPCHYEAELGVVIQSPLTNASLDEVKAAISGVVLALDLTKRSLQSRLKENGLPWERAKAFDGACPITSLMGLDSDWQLEQINFTFWIDGECRQSGNTSEMLFPVMPLIQHISEQFTLLPGDIVLTGTPKGVGQLSPGMQLRLDLMDQYSFESTVAS